MKKFGTPIGDQSPDELGQLARAFDLMQTRLDRADRARVYEQVLREGTEDDVRFYVDADQLLELWDELVLPASVRQAWTGWIERHHRAA